MDNRAVIERIMKHFAFEVEAVPNNKAAHADRTNSSKSDPFNVKIKVRKKEMNGPISEPEIVLRKVCLVNSAETIMSFDMFMETDSEKKNARKPRKRLFNKFKPGVSDDDDQPYTSDIVNSPDEPGGSSASKSDGILRQPFNLAKNSYETFFTTAQRKHRTFLGKKCKPGGCLDPPFGEDKYSYIPSIQESSTHTRKRSAEHRQIDMNENTKLDVRNIDNNKNKRKSKDLPLEIKSGDDKVKESSSILNLYKVESPRDSIITYPPEDINIVHKTRADTKTSEDKKSSDVKIFRPSSIEKSRQSMNETSFFNPVKSVKKDPSYGQQEPLKRHSFNPKSIKKPVPRSDSLNSVPLEQSSTGPSNINIEPKVSIFHKQIQSERDSKDIDKIGVKPFIVPIHVDEEVTPIDGQINSIINSKMESLIEEGSEEKLSIQTSYEPFITPICIDEDVSTENIDVIESPFVVIKKHSTQPKKSTKYSNDNKSPESYQLLLKPTQSPQKVHETGKDEEYDDSKEIKPIFVKERRDTNRILSEQNQPIDLNEENKPGVEKILSNKNEYLVTETSNESSEIISTDDQNSVSDMSVENEITQNKNKFRESSIESINDTDNTLTNINFDHKTRITEALTEELSVESESLNIRDDQSDTKSYTENQLLYTQDQNLKETAKNLDPSDGNPHLGNWLLDSPKQILDINSKTVYPSEPKLNLEEKDSITPEQSFDVNTKVVDSLELKPNLKDKHSSSHEQSVDINTKVLDPIRSEPELSLKDKYPNSHKESLDVNIEILDPSEPKLNLKDNYPNSHKESLDCNIKVLDPSEPKVILKDKDPNSHEENLNVNTELLDPSEPKLKLKDKYSYSHEENLSVNTEVFGPSEPKLNSKDNYPNSHAQSLDVTTKLLDPSEPKLNLEGKYSITPEQSFEVNTKVVDSLELKPNLKEKHSNSHEQSIDINTKVLDPSEPELSLKDKYPNSHKESLDVNIEILDPSEPKLNLKDRYPNSYKESLDFDIKVLDPSEPKVILKDIDPNSHEESLDVNTELLDPSEPILNSKNYDPNSHSQSLDVTTKLLDPSEPKLNLKDKDPIFHELKTQSNLKNNLLNIEHQNFNVNTKDTNSYTNDIDKNIFGGTESKLTNPSENKFDKEPLIQTGSIIEPYVKVKNIEDERKIEKGRLENSTQIPKDNQNIQIVSTYNLSNEEIITKKNNKNDYIPNYNKEIMRHGSLDKGKVSPNKIKKASLSPVDTSAICSDNSPLKSTLSESNKNTVHKPKKKNIPDINPTTDPRTVVLNLGFHSYINSNNERVIETIDGNKVNRYPQDSLSVIKSEIQLFNNHKYPKLNVPIDSTFDLAIKINQNYNRDDAVPAKTRIKPDPEFAELAKPSYSTSGKMNCEQIICYEKILQNTLTDIYKQKLIPLRKVLRDLKSDIDKLAGQQTIFKKRMHGLEKIKPPRLNVSNKKCGPCKQ